MRVIIVKPIQADYAICRINPDTSRGRFIAPSADLSARVMIRGAPLCV